MRRCNSSAKRDLELYSPGADYSSRARGRGGLSTGIWGHEPKGLDYNILGADDLFWRRLA